MAENYSSKASKWRKRYQIADSNQQELFKKYSTWYDIAYTVMDSSKMAAWRSKVVFPTLGDKAWQMMAKFAGVKPGFVATAIIPTREPEQPVEDYLQMISDLKLKEEKAQKKLEYDYFSPCLDEPMRDKLLATMMDALVGGTGLAKVPWSVKKISRYERLKDGYGSIDLTKEKVTDKIVGYNDLVPVNIFNVFISPSAYNLYKSPWVIIKEYKTLEDLEAVNEAQGSKYYKNLDQLKDAKATSDPLASYKASRNRMLNETDPVAADNTLNQFPVYECYELASNTITTFAEANSKDEDGWVELRSDKNRYWHGRYPLVPFYVRKRPHDFWGLGIFETNQRVDAAKRDLMNHYLDQWNISVDGGIISEEGSITNDYVIEPGFEITYKGAAPQQFKFPEPNPNQLTVVTQMLDREIENGTISPYASGTPNAATDTTAGTATGIMKLQEASGDTLSFFRTNFQESVRMIGEMWDSNNSQYMDTSVIVRDQKTGDPVEIKPQDMQFERSIRIDDASMQPLSQDQKVQQSIAYSQHLQVLQQASVQQAQMTKWAVEPVYIDFTSLAQDLAEQMGQVDINGFLLDKKEVQQAVQSSSSPMIMPNERINITPGDMLPTEIAQLLQRNGITPDPSRDQGQLPPQEQVMMGDAANMNAQAQTPNQQKLNTEQAKVGLQAQQQLHGQVMDAHQAMSQPDPATQKGDAEVQKMVADLAARGHVHPDILSQQ